MAARLLWYWYRLGWWTPESRAWRALHQHGRAIYCDMLRRGLDHALADRATEVVFNRLFARYRAGDQIPDIRQFAIDITFGESARRARERRRRS